MNIDSFDAFIMGMGVGMIIGKWIVLAILVRRKDNA